jgi:hypothetical protein
MTTTFAATIAVSLKFFPDCSFSLLVRSHLARLSSRSN